MQEDRKPEVLSLVLAPTRARQVADLPAELTAMTASYRMPERTGDGEACRPCGRCLTCKALAPHLPIYADRSQGGRDTTQAERKEGNASR